MNALFAPGAKRNRMFVAFGLSLLLATPAIVLWAEKTQRDDIMGEDAYEQRHAQDEARRLSTVALPEATLPPAEFSPFGGVLKPRRLQGAAAEGLLPAPTGDRAWDPTSDAVLQSLKPGLRWGQSELTRSQGFSVRPGLNYVRMSQSAIDQQGLDAVMASVAEIGTVISVLPRHTLLVNVEARNMHLLRQGGVIDAGTAMQPADKLAHDLGARPYIERARARDENLRGWVTLVPGIKASDVSKKVAALPGVSEVVESEAGGQLHLKVNYRNVDKVARLDEVLNFDEEREQVLFNDENVPTIQAGSAEDANLIRPFDNAGVDGGGIDTNADGQRINNGSDAVPPQLVLVTDNGISVDTPNFSQTATQVSGLGGIGPSHRKVHAIQFVVDSGTSCDGQLSGASTHGHIVASAIAAYPSQFGIGATRANIGGPTQPRNENMDGVARGARIIMQDAGTVSQCTINSLVERGGNVSPGSLTDRLANATLTNAQCTANLTPLPCCTGAGTGTCSGGGNEIHLGVMPFGAPSNFSTIQFLASNGTYPAESVQLDTFLYNNRDFMLFSPVGNNGGLVGTNRLGLALRVIPDLFNGSALDENPNVLQPIQIPPPSTAKNVTSVGSSTDDCFTFFGATDCEQTINNFTSRGPATPESLRMAPMIMAPAFDLIGTPMTAGVAVLRSNDNDNQVPIDAQLDEGNFGSSYSAAYMTGAGAIIRDYFAQGFYPTGDRTTANRLGIAGTPTLSGTVVKAALAASADFLEGGIATQGQDNNERDLRRTRCLDMGTVGGIQGSVQVDIMCNSEQGYGRPVLTDVLPLSNWPDNFVLHPASLLAREYPAAGLLIYDRLATGEPFINNTTQLSVTHTFRVGSPNVITKVAPAPDAGAVAVAPGQLRIAVSWADPPGAANQGGPLINDLDLVLESPGPDGNLATAADNVFYDGNRYDGGRNNANFDQWSLGRSSTTPVEKHDKRNNTEAVHLSADTNIDFVFTESPLYVGLWRITIKRGLGGANAGQITITAPTVAQDADQNEDDNNNGRLDPGEDNNANGLLDQLGQPYSLVVSGPVFRDPADAAPAAGPGAAAFPGSAVSWDANRYGCSANARLLVLDTTGTATPANVQSSTTYQVVNAAGAVTDSETSFTFAAGAVAGSFTSAAIPVRLGGPTINGNGILEADTGSSIVATYNRGGQAAITSRALVSCSPDLINAAFTAFAGNALGNQFAVNGGCDNDDNFDAGEVVTYGVALQNRSKVNNYADMIATLTPSGPGAGAIRVLDSPKNMGTFPGNGINGVFFHVFVDPTAANALSVANRVVTMTLSLDSLVRGTRISRQSYAFQHAINSDRETFFYSTDFPTGGRQVRDINRNLVVDPPDTVDPFLGFIVAREDVTFSTLFSGSIPAGTAPAGHFSNELGEDLNLDNVFNSATERNVVPNVDGGGVAILDKGILNSNNPADPNHRVPWNFDNNNGGWIPFRHPSSNAAGVNVNPLWEYKTSGLCGYQSSGGVAGVLDKFGIWHTGDGDPTSPASDATACDNHSQPNDPNTPARVELLEDILESPIVAKVNQNPDARNFSYVVEFQRFAYNENIQLVDGYAGGGVNIDNDIDNDSANSLLAQAMDQYYTRRTGGWPYGMFRDAGTYFPGAGIDPATKAPFQRTFGPFTNTNGSQDFDGDETGFTGHTQDSNDDSSTPIPTAIPDFLPFPVPGAPVIGVCDGGTQNDQTCDPANGSDPCVTGGGSCFAALNTVNGPVRNWDATLLGYEGGFASLIDNGPPENFFFFLPGKAGNRWQIGIGFWAMEGTGTLAGNTDYGKSIDDAVFEWKEYHPQDEAVLGAAPACARFNGIGQPQGGQCATLTADRTSLYECDEGMEVTVYTAKCKTIGTGNTAALYGACTTNGQCGTGGICTAALPSVQVQVVTDSDSVPVSAAGGQVRFPNAKLYTLPAVAGSPGLFRGTVIFSTTTNDGNHAYANPGTDGIFNIYFHDDAGCDADYDGQSGEDDFNNVDGDGVDDVGLDADNCPQVYNPGQEDNDSDGFGNFCDVCPDVFNDDQADSNADGVGDVCDFDDIDGDGVPNTTDNCKDVRNPNQSDIDPNNRGDLCDILKTVGTTFGTSAGAADCVGNTATTTGLCTIPGDAIGDVCTKDEDCIRNCHNNVCTQGNSGTAGGSSCISGPNTGQACTGAAQCTECVGGAHDGTLCSTAANCAGSCVGGTNPGAACTGNADCTGGGTCPDAGVCTGGTCSINFISPTLAVGRACVADGDCYVNDLDREGDGIVDALDNCVITDNGPLQGPNIQTDSDGDGLGNVCDGDCVGAHEVFKCRSNGNSCQVPESNEAGVCSAGPPGRVGDPCNSSTICGECTSGPVTGAAAGCANNTACGRCVGGTAPPTTPCADNTPCTGGGTCNVGTCSTGTCSLTVCQNTFGLGNVCGFYVANSGSCSAVNDDMDADGVADLADNCGTFPNPAVIAGTSRQRDNDRDGIGDACDPAGTFDDAQDGVPDDVVAFNGNIVCRTQPLANLAILAADYQDLDGDHDVFPDTGENGRIRLTLRNLGANLTDATVVLTSSDPDVACITKPTLLIPADPGNTPPQALGQWGAGVTRILGDFVNGNPGFQFIASSLMAYTGPPSPPPFLNFCITVVANETLGTASPTCFSLLGDLDPPPGNQPPYTIGNDGLTGTADDGTLVENFDVDKNGDGQMTVNDFFLQAIAPGTFRGYCSNAPLTACQTDNDCGGAPAVCYRASYIRGDATGVGVGTVAATSCGGFDSYGGQNTYCQLDPDFPFDWHVHCSPGALNCPNIETGSCVGGCSYATPVGGQKSHSGSNSLHMGAHFDQTDNLAGDTTHFRTIQGFQSGPVNLALFPGANPLELSFYHIARLMDNNGVGPGNERQCVDCGDVQIQLDRDGADNADDWGFWDKLVPFQNVYDHKPNAFSVFGGYYCIFTPTDTGTLPPNPKGVHETTCYPLGTWSHCGSTIGTVATATVDCAGPGEVDPTGVGVWVQSKFNLSAYTGQRIRLRWIAETWVFDEVSSDYFEIGGTWAATQQDDGWWLDDIRISSLIQTQFTPLADLAPSPGATCPSDPCNQALAGTDNGTQVILKITDLNNAVLDGVNAFPFAGQSIRVSAIDSSIPGGCVGGVAEYEFSKDGVVKQAFGPKSFYLDAPESSANYTARCRCSVDFTCTSIVGGSIAVNPYTGDGSDAIFANPPNQNLGVRYFRGVCTAGPNPLGGCNDATDCGAGGACNVTASTADDTSRYSVTTNAGNDLVDLYRGSTRGATCVGGPTPNAICASTTDCGAGGVCTPKSRGTRSGQFWSLSTEVPAAALTPNPHLPLVGSNPPSKAYAATYNQTNDANPAVGTVQYYYGVGHAPGGNPVNGLGCSMPGFCANLGWCSLGANAGAPCNVAGDCSSGSCTLSNSACATDAGTGDAGGCSKHQVCAGGTNPGTLCVTGGAAVCLGGGTCAAIPVSPAGVCLQVSGGLPASGCLPPGHPKRMVDQATVLAP